MEIVRGRMVHLGYGTFWRSDEIVGLSPIEEGRGPGRRTQVFVAGRPDPVTASRAERAILQDMVRMADEAFAAGEARELMQELIEELSDVPEVLRRLLRNEARVDLDAWERRVAAHLARDREGDLHDGQEDLFSAGDS